MDDYRQFMDAIEITPMPESFKVRAGGRVLPSPARHVELRAVRGSFAQVNLAVTAPAPGILLLEERPEFAARHPVADVFVLRAELRAPGLRGEIYPVGLVQDDDGVAKGDVLLSAGRMALRPWQTAQVTALVSIPPELPAGRYTGCIRFYAHGMLHDERLAREITFSVQVEAVTLPRGRERRFYLNLWQHLFNIARKHEVRACSPAHLEAVRPYARSLCRLGCRAATVVLSDIPWNGQGGYNDPEHPADLYEYNFVRIRRDAQGAFHYDFSFAESYVDMMAGYGAEDILLVGLYGVWTDEKAGFEAIVEDWPDPIRLSYRDERDGCLRFMRRRDEVEDYFRAVYRWLRDRGWLDRCCLMGDEVNLGWVKPGWEQVLARVHALLPGVRMDWDCEPRAMLAEPYCRERVDIYTPQIELWAAAAPAEQAAMRRRIAPGGKCLWSVCCDPPVMNSFLYTDLCEVRLHGLMTEHLGMDGFIRWNYTVWPEEPRTTLSFLGWPAGDTCFVYPGKGGQCLLSLRYLALRRGIEDYELAQMVKARCPGGGETVKRAIACVLRETDLRRWDFHDYHGREKYLSLNPEDYRRARDLLLDALTGAAPAGADENEEE